jgi:AraC family transcriptional regulator
MPLEQSSHLLADGPLVRVYDVACRAPRSPYGAAMFTAATYVGLPRSGVFLMERRGERIVVDANTAVVLRPGDEYRIAHPTSGGDEGIVLALQEHLVEDVVGGMGGRVGRLTTTDRLAVSVVTRTLRDSTTTQLEAEDATVLLLGSLSRGFMKPTSDGTRPITPAQRRRIEHVRALLATSPTTRWDLGRLGSTVRCSPFQLAREFRAVTGETISRYVLHLRLGLALERLAEGEGDIAALALDLGFAHHSHFSARFHRTFGITPRDARAMLTRGKLDDLRTISADARLD